MRKTGKKWKTEKCGRCGEPHSGYSGKLNANSIEYVVCENTEKPMSVDAKNREEWNSFAFPTVWELENPPFIISGMLGDIQEFEECKYGDKPPYLFCHGFCQPGQVCQISVEKTKTADSVLYKFSNKTAADKFVSERVEPYLQTDFKNIAVPFKAKDTMSEMIQDIAVKLSEEITLEEIRERGKPYTLTNFILAAFDDMSKIKKSGLMRRWFVHDESNPKFIKNPGRLFFQFWKPRMVPNPDYAEPEPFVMDIVRGDKKVSEIKVAGTSTKVKPVPYNIDIVDDLALDVKPIKKQCKSCAEAQQCGAGTSLYWWCDAGHWHGKPLENVKNFANSVNCHDFKLADFPRGNDA